ncbi:MAG: hypothetical protein ACOX2F_06730 [bacterium]
MKKNLPAPHEVRAKLKMMSGYHETKKALSVSELPAIKKRYAIKSDAEEIDEMSEKVTEILEREVKKLQEYALGEIEKFKDSLEIAMGDFLKDFDCEPVELVLDENALCRLKGLPLVYVTYDFEERLIFKGLGDLVVTKGKILGADNYSEMAVSDLEWVFETGIEALFKKIGIVEKSEEKTKTLKKGETDVEQNS